MPPKKVIKPKGKEGCRPQNPKLPTSLLPIPSASPIPSAILEKLEEFRNPQPFFSAFERIAPETASLSRMNSCWYGISGEVEFEREAEDGFRATIATQGTAYPVFIKRTHLLNPLECIEGECIWPSEGLLPAPSELLGNALQKLNDPMNEAYVDAVFAMVADRLVSTGVSPHWLRCFGTFPARVAKYMYNISDEYPSLCRKSFWTRHQQLGIFQLRKEVGQEGTRDARVPLDVVFSEEQGIDEGDFEIAAPPTYSSSRSLDAEEVDIPVEDTEPLQVNSPSVRIQRIESPISATSSTSATSMEDYMDYFAEFTDFPVQVSLLERAEGTMDELLDDENPLDATTEAKWIAWIFQVIAALNVAQHWFGFVHNDLHTNNVMWVRTDVEYLYYVIEGKGKKTYYKVPTYGYSMKIIDFGRATYHLPEPAGFFISDAFFPGNDAANQYNCEPFFDQKAGKKVEPNPSFDLSRLAVSMLEALYPTRPANATPIKIMSREGPKTYAETVSPLYNLLWEWLTDDDGKNILRSPNGEERYPDFDLYSAIAADVHKAIPWHQIEKPIFKGFQVDHVSTPAYTLWTY
jgi:hypothetical protein